MPQSLAKLYVHLVFSTKNRECILSDDIRRDLHAYMGGCLNGMKCVPIEINTEPDHAHVLFLLGRTASLSDVVGGLKKSATEWLRARSPQYAGFHWQAGYGAFSVSQSAVEGADVHPQSGGASSGENVPGRVSGVSQEIRNRI